MESIKTVVITGGTGSLGKELTRQLLKTVVQRIVIASRDEMKQDEMAKDFADSRLRFFEADVRDKERLYRAFEGADIVIHAAALKIVPKCEYNPFEAVKTNIIGSQNVIDAAIDKHVKRVMMISTDKAVQSLNLYGATKACAEKLFIAGNSYASGGVTRLSVTRYGNVVGSRGSVIPFFRKIAATTNVIPITDPRMTRFWITLPDAARFVLRCIDSMQGGEIFIPKIPSMKVTDLAEAVCPGCKQDIVGIRPGEKIHELLITPEEATRTIDAEFCYMITPEFSWWTDKKISGRIVADGFEYCSGTNTEWLTIEQLKGLIK